MLGRNLPKGSEAISFHNTLFRVSELCWIKAVRLSIPEIVIKVVSVLLAAGWVVAMARAKDTYANVEFLLAIFPLVLAWHVSGSLKIGCTGDFEESYEGRRGMQTSLFKSWIDGIRQREQDWLHLQGSNYDLLLNPHRVAWVRPCFQWKSYPLVVVGVFAAYLYLLGLDLNLESYPVLGDFKVLFFDGGAGTIRNLSYLIILTSLAAFFLSIKRSVEICGTGGVQDVFPLSAKDQAAVLGILAGSEVKRETRPAQVEVEKAAPERVSKTPPPSVKKVEPARPVVKEQDVVAKPSEPMPDSNP